MAIMRIDGPAVTVPARPSTGRKATGFRLEAGGTDLVQSTAETGGIGLAGLLALQEEPERGDAAALRRGKRLLNRLTALQRALLDGSDPGGMLSDLARDAQALPDADDPALGAAVAAVALRAQVELAKREAGWES